MIYALRCLYFSVIATTVLLLGSCDDGMEEITNSQPTIGHVIVPEEVKAGQKVILEIIAHDADDDKLTYKWEVSEGTVDAVGVWTVPAEATSATVLVHVSDGVNTSVASSKISVEIVAPPDPSKPVALEGMVPIPAGEFQMGAPTRRLKTMNSRCTPSTSMRSLWTNTRSPIYSIRSSCLPIRNGKESRLIASFTMGNT